MEQIKLKDGIILTDMNDVTIAVDTSIDERRFHGIVRMNGTAAFIVKQLQNIATIDSVTAAMTTEYDVSAEVARENAERVIKQLKEQGLVSVVN